MNEILTQQQNGFSALYMINILHYKQMSYFVLTNNGEDDLKDLDIHSG